MVRLMKGMMEGEGVMKMAPISFKMNSVNRSSVHFMCKPGVNLEMIDEAQWSP